jgi:type IV secretion system protein VirB6
MVCPAVTTGSRFLETAIANVDCQAQSIGSYGYGALADPGSSTSYALTAMLTIFVAIYGYRLLFGQALGSRDLIGDALRLAIVLTLATSWPAWRVLGYDLVINGPTEIANQIGLAAQLPGSSGDLASRLQRVDDALALFYERGTGRRGVANGDWFQLGFARIAFLIGTLGPLALIRLITGILLAIAPLIAGLLLFTQTRSIFAGWAKGLATAFLAMISVSIILAVELAILEPWIASVVKIRLANDPALGAPAEILVLAFAFALISFAAFAFSAWMVFHVSIRLTQNSNGWGQVAAAADQPVRHFSGDTIIQAERPNYSEPVIRSRAVAASITRANNRELRATTSNPDIANPSPLPQHLGRNTERQASHNREPVVALGSAYRRSHRRISAISARRDGVA